MPPHVCCRGRSGVDLVLLVNRSIGLSPHRPCTCTFQGLSLTIATANSFELDIAPQLQDFTRDLR